MNLNDFSVKFADLSDQKLADIIANKADYRPEVYEIATREFEYRNIPLELAEDMSVVQLDEKEELLLLKAEKIRLSEKIIYLFIPILGLASLLVKVAEGRLQKKNSKGNESVIYTAIGFLLWLILWVLA